MITALNTSGLGLLTWNKPNPTLYENMRTEGKKFWNWITVAELAQSPLQQSVEKTIHWIIRLRQKPNMTCKAYRRRFMLARISALVFPHIFNMLLVCSQFLKESTLVRIGCAFQDHFAERYGDGITPCSEAERSLWPIAVKCLSNLLLVRTPLTLGLQYYTYNFVRLDPSTTFPLKNRVKSIIIGSLSWITCQILLAQTLKTLYGFNENRADPVGGKGPMQPTQFVGQLMKDSPIVALLASLVCPVVEELLFRGDIRNYFALREKPAPNLLARLRERIRVLFSKAPPTHPLLNPQRMLTVLKTALIFGVAHLDLTKGWENNKNTVLNTTLIGLSTGILREITGNLWSPTAAHVANNLYFALRIHNLIPNIPYAEV